MYAKRYNEVVVQELVVYDDSELKKKVSVLISRIKHYKNVIKMYVHIEIKIKMYF